MFTGVTKKIFNFHIKNNILWQIFGNKLLLEYLFNATQFLKGGLCCFVNNIKIYFLRNSRKIGNDMSKFLSQKIESIYI